MRFVKGFIVPIDLARPKSEVYRILEAPLSMLSIRITDVVCEDRALPSMNGVTTLEQGPKRKLRMESVDFLRGLVMVIMALDHVRFFLHRDILLGIDPLDLTKTNGPLFLTRWITHLVRPRLPFSRGNRRVPFKKPREKQGRAVTLSFNAWSMADYS